MIILIFFLKLLATTYCIDVFYGAITPSTLEDLIETNIKWHIRIDCDECIKDGKTQQITKFNLKNEKEVKFEFNLVPAPDKVFITKLNVKITSLDPIGGQKRSNKWTLTFKNQKVKRFYLFQFGHFRQQDEEKGLYLRLKFNNPLDDNYLIKVDNEPKMHYLIKIYKEKDRKKELANKILEDDEWQGKVEFDLKLDKTEITSYINSSKKYPLVIIVKAV
uniref:Galectin n=1 Tax=Meloidogyne hapla TaxID=6305 RepID=A0A1I8BFR0_MELHA